MKKRNKLFTYTMTLLLCGGLLFTSCEEAINDEENTTESSEATHTHSFSDQWESDSTHHWHECECGEVFDSFSEHEFDSFLTNDTDTHIKMCSICGYSETESHTISLNQSKSKSATCLTTGYNHYECLYCEYFYEVETPATGIHMYDEGEIIIEAGCYQEGLIRYTCIECGLTYDQVIEKTSHTYGERSYQYYDETYCWRVCSICGEGDESSLTEHNLYPYIGYNEEGHFYHCTRCDASVGVQEHTFDQDWQFTYDSSDSNYYYHTKACSVCGYTIKEHHDIYYWDTGTGFHRRGCYTCDWVGPNESHEYETTGEVVESTCSENGYYVRHCVYCGCDAHVSLDLETQITIPM